MSNPTVSVWSDLQRGLTITQERRVEHTQDGVVTVRHIPIGEPVTLQPGANVVDEAWITSWLAAHAADEVVWKGLIRVLEPQPPLAA